MFDNFYKTITSVIQDMLTEGLDNVYISYTPFKNETISLYNLIF